MKIYTSYFGQLKNLRNAGILPISIARYSPRWYRGDRITMVAPTPDMLRDTTTHDEYLRKYEDILKNFNLNSFLEAVSRLSKGKDVALCCYETPEEFCHRHLLADWLSKNTQYQVIEWKQEEKNKNQQLLLF